jgi:hypothetical protein
LLNALVRPFAQALAAGVRLLRSQVARIVPFLGDRGQVLDPSDASVAALLRRAGQESVAEGAPSKNANNRPGGSNVTATLPGHKEQFREEGSVGQGPESLEQHSCDEDLERIARRAKLAAAAESRLALGLRAPHPREPDLPEEEMV